MIGKRLGGYEVRAVLGEGGMGTVYEGYDRATGERVAIKVLHEELAKEAGILRRFQEEARALSRVKHEHLVKVLRVGQEEGRHYYVMEYIPGRTLEEVLAKNGSLRLDVAVGVMGHVMAALDAVHRAGIVHRDLKPANIMLDKEGRAILMDFGLAKSWDRETLTTLGALLGTPEYMAPEQAQGGKVDPRTDIYALGALFFELLTGRPPFRGDSTISVIRQHIESPPPSLLAEKPDLPPAAEAIIRKAMAKNPDDRYANLPEMAKDMLSLCRTRSLISLVKSFSRGETLLSPPSPGSGVLAKEPNVASSGGGRTPFFGASPRSRPWRWKLIAAAIALVGLLLEGGIVLALALRSREGEMPLLREPPSQMHPGEESHTLGTGVPPPEPSMPMRVRVTQSNGNVFQGELLNVVQREGENEWTFRLKDGKIISLKHSEIRELVRER